MMRSLPTSRVVHAMTRLALFVALAACTGVQSNPIVDAAPDAPPDMPDTPPDNKLPHRYIMSTQVVPTTQTQARDNGLDLDGDSQVDNQLGAVMAALEGQGFDVAAPATRAVDHGDTLMLIDFESDGFQSGAATFTLFAGTNPRPPACQNGSDPVCRHHLDGHGVFDVATGAPRDTPLSGTMVNGRITTAAGDANRLHLQVALATTAPFVVPLLAARVTVTGPSEAGITSGVVAGGVAKSDIDGILLPAWQQSFNTLVQQGCNGAPPTCSCPAGSQAKVLHDLFDTTPNDCSISLSELANNSLVKSLLAPDLTIGGQQAISLGIGFSAVQATYTP
jgi:hypothetical protein